MYIEKKEKGIEEYRYMEKKEKKMKLYLEIDI